MSVHEVIALFIYGFSAAKDVVASLYIGDNQPKVARMSTFVCVKYRYHFCF
jgi:hypothetical protein